MIRMPEHYGELSPLLHVVPLQLLAYHTACARDGCGQAPKFGEACDGGVVLAIADSAIPKWVAEATVFSCDDSTD